MFFKIFIFLGFLAFANTVPSITPNLLKKLRMEDGRVIIKIDEDLWYVIYSEEDDPRSSYEGHLTSKFEERGLGRLLMKDGTTFDGKFVDSERFYGKISYPDGHTRKSYKGEVLSYEPWGKGVLEMGNGVKEEGKFINGVLNGAGARKYMGSVCCDIKESEGNFKNGKLDGHGAIILENKVIFKGIFVNGEPSLMFFAENYEIICAQSGKFFFRQLKANNLNFGDIFTQKDWIKLCLATKEPVIYFFQFIEYIFGIL